MYLEPWMLGVLALTYGVCAWWNRMAGMKYGSVRTLDLLEHDKIITVTEDGDILPYKQVAQ